MKKLVNQGDYMPRGYGLAWLCATSTQGVCYPIPLNWLFRWIRDLYFFLARGPKRRQWELIAKQAGEDRYRSLKVVQQAAFDRGVKEGKRQAYVSMFPGLGYSPETIETVLEMKRNR